MLISLFILISVATVSSFTFVTYQTHGCQTIGIARIKTSGGLDFASSTIPAITSLKNTLRQEDEDGLSNEAPSRKRLYERFGKRLKKGKNALFEKGKEVRNVFSAINSTNQNTTAMVQKIRDRVQHLDLDSFSFGNELNDLGNYFAGKKLNVTQVMEKSINLTSFGIKAAQNFLETRGIIKFLQIFSNEKICTRFLQLFFVTIVLPIFKPASYISGFGILKAAFKSISKWASCNKKIPPRLIEAILFMTSAWCVLGESLFQTIVSMMISLPSQIPTMIMVKEFVSHASFLSLLSELKAINLTALFYGTKSNVFGLYEIIIHWNPRKFLLVNVLVILTLRIMAESIHEIRSDRKKKKMAPSRL